MSSTGHPEGHSRRTFLGGAALAAGAGAAAVAPGIAAAATKTPAPAKPAPAAPYSESKRVDMHAHYIAPVYRDALGAQKIPLIGGIPIPDWTPELAIEFMNKFGIQLQMLSISDPGVTFVPQAQQAGLARACNDYIAGVVAANPSRFGAFAVLPLPDVAASIAEINRWYDSFGLDGVGMLSSYNGVYLGDPALDPVLDALDKRKAWVKVHPTAISTKPKVPWPDFSLEYPVETSRAFYSLLLNGAFKQFPNIRWQFVHGGGVLPPLVYRLTTLTTQAAPFGALLGLPSDSSTLVADDAVAALAAAYYDTALVSVPPSAAAVRGLTTLDHMFWGSDWPFTARVYAPLPAGDPTSELSKTFNAAERKALDRLNARKQFPRIQGFVPGT